MPFCVLHMSVSQHALFLLSVSDIKTIHYRLYLFLFPPGTAAMKRMSKGFILPFALVYIMGCCFVLSLWRASFLFFSQKVEHRLRRLNDFFVSHFISSTVPLELEWAEVVYVAPHFLVCEGILCFYSKKSSQPTYSLFRIAYHIHARGITRRVMRYERLHKQWKPLTQRKLTEQTSFLKWERLPQGMKVHFFTVGPSLIQTPLAHLHLESAKKVHVCNDLKREEL